MLVHIFVFFVFFVFFVVCPVVYESASDLETRNEADACCPDL